MNCLYCDKEIDEFSLYDLMFEEDRLCKTCRRSIIRDHQKFYIEDMEVETFFKYNSLFKDILLQYKECYDETLKDVFLYQIKDYIKVKYHGYKILYVPSSKKKIEERGFNHLKLIFDELNFNEVYGIKMINDLSQLSKNYQERLEMINNYTYEGNSNLNKVLIVDDVYTTGSSIKGVYKVIRPHCQKIKALILAKT